MILTLQSKQHAPVAVGPRPAPGVTLLTSGLWHLFRTLQSLTLGVTAVIEKLSRHVRQRGPSVEPTRHAVHQSGHKRSHAVMCQCDYIQYKAVNYCVEMQQTVIWYFWVNILHKQLDACKTQISERYQQPSSCVTQLWFITKISRTCLANFYWVLKK